MMKKYMSLFLAAAMAVSCLAGCGQSNSDSDSTVQPVEESTEETTSETADAPAEKTSTEKIKVVTTIFPEYDWVRQIAGDQASNMELTMLLDNGVDLHSYQPTADDIMKISDADLFIYVGGESDGWVDGALKEAVNQNMQVINLLEVLGNSVKEEEVVEGMEAEEEEKSEEGEEEEPEYDEHVWLSLRNAETLCSAIAEALDKVDPANKETYDANLAAYEEELQNLDTQYQEAADQAPQKTLLFGDRFPFRYLVDDYGLSYYAAFVGCSAETEASFETISFLAKKVDELGLKNVMTIEKSDQKIAKTIIENTKDKNQNILTLDSMQSTTSEDVANGTTYLSVMEKNLEVLKEALQ